MRINSVGSTPSVSTVDPRHGVRPQESTPNPERQSQQGAAQGAPNPQEQQRQVTGAIERLNKMARAFTSLRFSVHQETNTIMVRVVDDQSGEVVREIPPEAILDAVAKMQEMMGLLFDAKA